MSKKKPAQKQTGENTPAGNPPPNQPSKRQTLTKQTRDAATALQSATRPTDSEPAYDVPDVQTPDENNPKFKNYAASFHKLFEHDTKTGLLTPNGVTSYQNFLKGLNNPSDPSGTPNSNFDQGALNAITLAATTDNPPRVLINPQSSKSLTIKGGDVAAYRFKSQPVTDKSWEIGYKVVYAQGEADTSSLLQELSFASGYSAAEMVEVYAMALLRDLDFDAYNVPNPDVQLALDALNAFGDDFRGPKEKQGGKYRVTTRTLFRGNSPESLRGGYLSKFLLLRRPPLFASGCAPGTADIINAGIFFGELSEALTAPQPNPGREFSLTWDDYVAIQNRQIPQRYQPGDFKGRVVISNGRNLAGQVHVDSLYQEHAFAVDVLTGGNYPRTPVSPYTPPKGGGVHAKNEGDGPTLGPPDAAGLVGAVALEAARLAWSQKYLIARRARPEVFGALVHKRKTGGGENTYGPLDPRILNNPAVGKLLERVKEVNAGRGGPDAATYLLSQVFPEAAPAHPAWPSGHATVAGACVTVIKAIFDDRAQVLQQIDCNPSPACPNANDNSRVDPPPFTDQDGNPLTVGGELDKLASNIALGRNFGGVHFRSDGEHGILLGERAAIRFLRDHLRTYRERFRCDTSPGGTDPCFEFSTRNGRRIKITAEGVSAVEDTEEAAARPAPEKRTDRTHV